MNWQGNDGTNIPALAVAPVDAGSESGIFSLSIKIGEALDNHHHCPILMVHWPDRVSDSFEDLKRVLQFAPVFGEFVTFDAFNESIYDNGFSENYEADDYHYSWLQAHLEKTERDPVSRYVRYWKRHYELRTLQQTLGILDTLFGNATSTQLTLLQEVQDLNEQLLESDHASENPDLQIRALQQAANLQAFRQTMEPLGKEPAMIMNAMGVPSVVDWKEAEDVLVAPAFSFVQISNSSGKLRPADPAVIGVDPDNDLPTLRNEYFEVRFSETTGGVKSVNRHEKRGNLFSQQLATRVGHTVSQHGFPRLRFSYCRSEMKDMKIVEQRKSSATICSRVHLIDEATGEQHADIEQFVTVVRNSRRIEFRIKVHSIREFEGPVWNNYLCSRLALPDKELAWYRSDHEIRVPVRRDKIVAPQFVEIHQTGTSKLSLLSGGLPFHRRVDHRKLDTLLMVQGETAREFEFAIAVDSPTSAAAATSYLTPLVVLPNSADCEINNGWIFSLNCKNILVTWLSPKYSNEGSVNGVSLRLIETEKRSGELKIRFPFELKSAKRTDFHGAELNPLDFEADQIVCNFCENQYFQVECSW